MKITNNILISKLEFSINKIDILTNQLKNRFQLI